MLRDVPPIVSVETWTKANALLDAQLAARPQGRPAQRLFAGVLRCACGPKMYARGPEKYSCRSCSRKIPIEDLEEVFRHELQSFFVSEGELRAFLDQDDADIAAKEEQARILEGERRKGVAEMERLYRAFQNEELAGKTFGKLHGDLQERQEAIDGELAKLQAEIDLRRINHLSSEEVIAGARDLYGRWGSLSFEEKRAIVETIVEEIVLGETIEISLAYLPGGGGQKATNQHGFMAATS